MRRIVLIAHNLRSCHNVGSLLRTAEGLGVETVYLTGYSPYPEMSGDQRLPHIRSKLNKQIAKTSLGAEQSQVWQHNEDIVQLLAALKADGYQLLAIEQATTSIQLPQLQPPEKVALVVGREVEGIEAEVLTLCDHILEIPMFGTKESFNVVQAAAMGLYHCRFAV